MIAVLTNPEQARHREEGHPERPERVAAILDAIAASHPDLTIEPSPKVPESLISQLHDPQYVAMLDRAATTGGGYLDPDTYITPDSMVAARTAAGGVVEGVNRVIDGRARHAIAIVRPPGHHAERTRAMGFCLINNIGIAVLAARERQVQRIAILDIDVHHGNGTQHSFEEDPLLLYTSTHQFPFYPGTGRASERGAQGNVINVPLAAGSGDVAFLEAWEKKIGAAIDDFKPELLLVSAGFDAHRDDPLAGLDVTTAGYRRLAELIETWALRHTGGRTVWALEGGYNLAALGESVVACLDSLRNTAGGDRPA